MSKIKDKMTRFATYSDSSFNDPYSSSVSQPISRATVSRVVDNDDDDEPKSKKKKKKKKSKEDKLLEMGRVITESFNATDSEAFDQFISEYNFDDEDITLKNSLLSKGRKYSRETKLSQESSEIVKAFSGHEKMLHDMVDEIDGDIDLVEKDISHIRGTRAGRNSKTLTDMIGNKKELYQVKLQTVKELNSMTKTRIELEAKARDKNEDASGDSTALINRAIGSMIGGGGRKGILDNLGGYSAISGARDDNYEDDDNIIEGHVVDDSDFDDENLDEGRMYLKYENSGVQLVVVDHGDSFDVVAEDRDGNIIPNYPIPKNVDTLKFDVNEKLGTATDDYHRPYLYRKE